MTDQSGLSSDLAITAFSEPREETMPPSSKKPTEEGGVAAVDRALSILRAFRSGDEALTLAELAVRTGTYKSTVLRLIQSLIRGRLLLRREDGRYQVGSETLRLGTLYQKAHRLGDVVLPVMRTLMENTGESVVLYVREGDARVVLHRVESRQSIRYSVQEGDILPLTAGSGGNVLSAFSGADDPVHRTIREKMYHASYGERDPDISGMSAPLFGSQQSLVGALSIVGPRSRIDASFVVKYLPALLDAVADLTSHLGGNSAVFASAREAVEAASTARQAKGTDRK